MIEIRKPQFSFFFSIVMAVSLVLGASTRIQAGEFTSNINTPSGQEKVAGTDPATEPAFKDYKGVRIGMSADEVAEKLGEPAVKDENEGRLTQSPAAYMPLTPTRMWSSTRRY